MKIRVETVFDNIDQEWLDWYLERLGKQECLPGSPKIVEELKECGLAVFSSKDPDSGCVATTTYEISRPLAN